MSVHSQPHTARFAHDLRANLTPAEVRLWSVLRKRQRAGARFRRQHPIGPFVVDFCAPRLKLVIEVDGSQHVDLHAYDQRRTAYLAAHDYRVLRFWNNQVMDDLNAVVIAIDNAVDELLDSKNDWAEE
jgi:very-short-patch-repair endonuclease